MFKIKCITDVITNSSNETFIFKKGEVPSGEVGQEFDWASILKGWCTNLSRDEMILVLEKGLGEPMGNSHSWDNCGWSEEVLEETWKKFVEENKTSFKKLLDLVYVEGKSSNEFQDYDDWQEYNESLREKCIMFALADHDFIETWTKLSKNS